MVLGWGVWSSIDNENRRNCERIGGMLGNLLESDLRDQGGAYFWLKWTLMLAIYSLGGSQWRGKVVWRNGLISNLSGVQTFV